MATDAGVVVNHREPGNDIDDLFDLDIVMVTPSLLRNAAAIHMPEDDHTIIESFYSLCSEKFVHLRVECAADIINVPIPAFFGEQHRHRQFEPSLFREFYFTRKRILDDFIYAIDRFRPSEFTGQLARVQRG